jgi:hypothetical protein
MSAGVKGEAGERSESQLPTHLPETSKVVPETLRMSQPVGVNGTGPASYKRVVSGLASHETGLSELMLCRD